jgi:hypothetical protein
MKNKYLLLLFLLAFATPCMSQDYWQLYFQPDGSVQHEALLYKTSTAKWIMRVRFYSEACACYDIVEQKMRRETTSAGFRLAGYDPISVRTGYEHDSYIADNLYFEEDEDGETQVTNRDDAGVETAVTGIVKIETNAELQRLLTRFKWN